MTGRFITLEGGEGTGKSTQIKRLAAALEQRGVKVLATREPGGSPGAEQIRQLMVEGEPGRWDAITETLLAYAARADHVARTIGPALLAGSWVISDRFNDSTFAYQGAGRGIEGQRIRDIAQASIRDFRPGLTLILDAPVDDALGRIASRDHAEDRFERFDRSFHERLRDHFQQLAKREPERCVLIDSMASIDGVARQIWCAVATRFKL